MHMLCTCYCTPAMHMLHTCYAHATHTSPVPEFAFLNKSSNSKVELVAFCGECLDFLENFLTLKNSGCSQLRRRRTRAEEGAKKEQRRSVGE
jgi:hypothetical protein